MCIKLKTYFLVEIQEMMNTTSNPEQQEIQKNILLRRHKEELKQTDMKLVVQLDQKVIIISQCYLTVVTENLSIVVTKIEIVPLKIL